MVTRIKGPRRDRQILNIYIHEEEIPLIDELDELRWKDRWSLSKIIIEAIKEYLDRHRPGNPQTPLTSYLSQPLVSVPTDTIGTDTKPGCQGCKWTREECIMREEWRRCDR